MLVFSYAFPLKSPDDFPLHWEWSPKADWAALGLTSSCRLKSPTIITNLKATMLAALPGLGLFLQISTLCWKCYSFSTHEGCFLVSFKSHFKESPSQAVLSVKISEVWSSPASTEGSFWGRVRQRGGRLGLGRVLPHACPLSFSAMKTGGYLLDGQVSGLQRTQGSQADVWKPCLVDFLHTTEESKGEAECEGLWVLRSHLKTKTSDIVTQCLWMEGGGED